MGAYHVRCEIKRHKGQRWTIITKERKVDYTEILIRHACPFRLTVINPDKKRKCCTRSQFEQDKSGQSNSQPFGWLLTKHQTAYKDANLYIV